MVHAFINHLPIEPMRSVSQRSISKFPANDLPANPEPHSSEPHGLEPQLLAEQLRRTLVELQSTLLDLETSASNLHERLQINSLNVQLQGLDTLLKQAIVLLQMNEQAPTLDRYLLPDSRLQEIRTLFMQITEALQRVENWHQS